MPKTFVSFPLPTGRKILIMARTKNVVTPKILEKIWEFYSSIDNQAKLAKLTSTQSARLLKVELDLPFTPTETQMCRMRREHQLYSLYNTELTMQAGRRRAKIARRGKELPPSKLPAVFGGTEPERFKPEPEPVAGVEERNNHPLYGYVEPKENSMTGKVEWVPVQPLAPAPLQDNFDMLIGRLDRQLSELIIVSEMRLDQPNVNTLVHHAEDMIGAGLKILKNLGYHAVSYDPPKAAKKKACD